MDWGSLGHHPLAEFPESLNRRQIPEDAGQLSARGPEPSRLADLEDEFRGALDDLSERVPGEPGLEILGQRLFHLNARW